VPPRWRTTQVAGAVFDVSHFGRDGRGDRYSSESWGRGYCNLCHTTSWMTDDSVWFERSACGIFPPAVLTVTSEFARAPGSLERRDPDAASARRFR
jgi:hypothetical protein